MTYADPDLDLRILATMKAMMAAATHTPKQHEAGGKRKIGIPDREAEIVEGLAVILAADLAGDHAVEIDLAAEGLGDTLAYHGDERRAEGDESDQNQQDAENSDHGVSQCLPWAVGGSLRSARAQLQGRACRHRARGR